MPKFWIFVELKGDTTEENIKENINEFFGNASAVIEDYDIVVAEVK